MDLFQEKNYSLKYLLISTCSDVRDIDFSYYKHPIRLSYINHYNTEKWSLNLYSYQICITFLDSPSLYLSFLHTNYHLVFQFPILVTPFVLFHVTKLFQKFLKDCWIPGLHIVKYHQMSISHCVKNVHIRSYFGPHFSAFELNAER